MEEKEMGTQAEAGAQEEQARQESHQERISGQELIQELDRLGHKVAEVVEIAWNSEQRKHIQEDLRRGLSALVANLEQGLQEVSQKPQTREILEKAEDVAESVGEKVRSSKVAQELAAGLVQGLRALSERMDRLAAELQEKQPTSQGDAETGEQEIPIDRE
ncbi:hypothetical protein FKZ61_019395 [Litorilinea aerophila]|uniref:Uncharacterized protein n=1 Tax=Litorilinea aerophila TaxID=1204385 RepID=A0A540VAT4_9CHLR|nr:hypothetical protein [Litorilinea aerophila]MCC9078268.1 hypothetical protein [Litorilinea aerophila]OUC07676.1 hypothetical protein RY27_13455 [Litorilinea aerophila]GIV77489.1 MAG: hypothetical protein KatS3mg050_1883 [Litorilinea sp.]